MQISGLRENTDFSLSLQGINGRLQGLAEETDVVSVNEAVVGVNRDILHDASVGIFAELAPGNSRNAVVPVEVALAGDAGGFNPRQAGKIDEWFRWQVIVTEEGSLRRFSELGFAVETDNIFVGTQGADFEGILTGLKEGVARESPVVFNDFSLHYPLAEGRDAVDSPGDTPDHGMVDPDAVLFAEIV